MSKLKIKFSRRANAQLRNIFSYIAENDAPAAYRMLDTLESRANSLKDTPFIGIELPQSEYPFLLPGYRRLIVKPFILYYRIDKQTVWITHIIHEKRHQANALKE